MIWHRESTYKEKSIFKLQDSNVYVGDWISFEDAATVLEIADNSKSAFFDDVKNLKETSSNFIYRPEFGKYKGGIWRKLMKKYNPNVSTQKISFEEYTIKAILRKTFPDIKIEQQFKFKQESNKVADFKLTLYDKTIILEYYGPSHFYRVYDNPEEPLIRKREIEDSGYEVIIWPYWIQLCEANVKSIFFPENKGLGALWGTKYYFSNMCFANSASIIKDLTNRFNAIDDDGVGYFYEGNSKGRVMPQHFIIQSILEGEEDYTILIPKGGEKEPEFWLPKELHHLIRK